jgi:hypothetical protein
VVVVLLVACVSIIGAFFVVPSPASADPASLASVILVNTLPGLVATPAGPTNGPINLSDIAFLEAGNKAGIAGLTPFLASGELSGYVRTWLSQPPNGEVVVIYAYRWKTTDEVSTFMSGINAGEVRGGGSKFAVPSIAGANGYSFHDSSLTEYQVTVISGTSGFLVSARSSAGQLTSADAVTVAQHQAAIASSTDSSRSNGAYGVAHSFIYSAGQVFAVILVLALITFFVLRSRRKVSVPLTITETSSNTPPLATHTGWREVPGNPSQQIYWDGHAWTARKEWNGSAWEDIPTTLDG